MRNSIVWGGVVLVLGLSGIGAYVYLEKQKMQAQPQAVATATPSTLLPPTKALALSELYGIASNSESAMISPKTKVAAWFEKTVRVNDDVYHTAFFGRQDLDSKGEPENSSHAAAVPVDTITFRLSSGKWAPIFRQKSVFEAGAWGQLPENPKVEIIELGGTKAILVEFSSMNQGYTVVGQQIIALESTGMKSLGVAITGGDNAGSCESDPKKITPDGLQACWSYSGTITPGKASPGKSYPDITITRTGTVADPDGKIVPAKPKLVSFNGPLYAENWD